MTAHGDYTEIVTLRMSVDEKLFIQGMCPQDVSLSRFIVACALVRGEQIAAEKRDGASEPFINGWNAAMETAIHAAVAISDEAPDETMEEVIEFMHESMHEVKGQ